MSVTAGCTEIFRVFIQLEVISTLIMTRQDGDLLASADGVDAELPGGRRLPDLLEAPDRWHQTAENGFGVTQVNKRFHRPSRP